MEDKVLTAFNDASDDYDKYRKQAIPNMDIYYNTVVKLTENYEKPKILDLGAGAVRVAGLCMFCHLSVL